MDGRVKYQCICIPPSLGCVGPVPSRQTCNQGHTISRVRILPSFAPDKTREAACQAGTRQAMWGGGHPNSRQGPPNEIRQACAPRADPWIWIDAGHGFMMRGSRQRAMPYVILEPDLAFRCCVLDKPLHTAYQKGANSNESQRPVQSASPSPSTMYVQIHLTPSKAPDEKKSQTPDLCLIYAHGTLARPLGPCCARGSSKAQCMHRCGETPKPTKLRAHGITTACLGYRKILRPRL